MVAGFPGSAGRFWADTLTKKREMTREVRRVGSVLEERHINRMVMYESMLPLYPQGEVDAGGLR